VTNMRRNYMINLLRQSSPLSAEQLARKLEVSESTVRRDILEMERDGVVIRRRGEVSLPGLGIEPLFVQREQKNLELKRQIARYAADQIHDGEVIVLDVGTTLTEMAKVLLTRSNLTVFTSSFQVASILAGSSVQVYLVGGLLRKSEMSMVGSIAKETIGKFNFDRFYVGIAGIDEFSGPTDYSLDDVDVKRAFIGRSKEVIALADKTKFGQSALVKVCDWEDLDGVITNAGAAEGLSESFPYRHLIVEV
jgi:DeoR/GlpR family transcriptional regulator of sugar metabolism